MLVNDKYDRYMEATSELISGKNVIGQDMFASSKEYQSTTDRLGNKIPHEQEIKQGDAIYQSMKARNFNKNNFFSIYIVRQLRP